METSANPRPVPFLAGRYRCEAYLGGGMADVYRARDTELPRDVAIKILKPSSQNDPDMRAAFLDEVQLASCCSHENIVMTYDKGDFEGSPYIVMEFLRGENLDKLIKNGQQGDLKRILQTALQIARALEYVHSQNIVHRDLKPQNLHVDQHGRVKLVDFGIAKAVDWNKTQVGLVKGTAYYMSPEQIMGEPVTFRTDIWSFGVVLYEMLCEGKRPFQGGTLDILWASIVNGTPDYVALSEKQIPEFVLRILRQCLEKKAENRYADFNAVAGDIEAALSALSMAETSAATVGIAAQSPAMKRLPAWLVAGGVSVAAVCIGLLVYHLVAGKPAKEPLARQITTPTGDMVLVDAGPALIGGKKLKMTLKAFYIDKTEVSNGDYARFLRDENWHRPIGFSEDKPTLPVVNVTLYDAIAFATWAGKRLPTSDEWEKAARGTMGFIFPWGNDSKPELANVSDNVTLTKHELMPVSSFPAGASPYGALNMCGNVWEWVKTPQSPNVDALKAMERELKTKFAPDERYYGIRGGYFGVSLLKDSTSGQYFYPAGRATPDIGFRCAKNAEVR
jgi:predicted Ser/Thr protein kinase